MPDPAWSDVFSPSPGRARLIRSATTRRSRLPNAKLEWRLPRDGATQAPCCRGAGDEMRFADVLCESRARCLTVPTPLFLRVLLVQWDYIAGRRGFPETAGIPNEFTGFRER